MEGRILEWRDLKKADVVWGCVERPEVVEETKLPKALLQQHCQKMQWPPPRFERLAMGGLRMSSAGIRYSATLEMPPTNGRKKKVSCSLLIPCLLGKHVSSEVTLDHCTDSVCVGTMQNICFT